jgi:hypothetical protein
VVLAGAVLERTADLCAVLRKMFTKNKPSGVRSREPSVGVEVKRVRAALRQIRHAASIVIWKTSSPHKKVVPLCAVVI